MSIGRPQGRHGDTRDYAADYRQALIEEYNSYVIHPHLKDKAAEVATELKRLGEKVPAGIQRAVDPAPLEQVIPVEPVKRAPGRPKKPV